MRDTRRDGRKGGREGSGRAAGGSAHEIRWRGGKAVSVVQIGIFEGGVGLG